MVPIATAGGNIVGLELLERSGTSAVDELMIELPDGSSIDRLRHPLEALEGVIVEELRTLRPGTGGRAHRLVSSAIAILETANPTASLDSFIGRSTHLFSAEWSVLIDLPSNSVLLAHGDSFDIDRLLSSATAPDPYPPEDPRRTPGVLAGDLLESGLVLYLGRRLFYRSRERHEFEMLVRVADRMCRPVRGDRIPADWVSRRML